MMTLEMKILMMMEIQFNSLSKCFLIQNNSFQTEKIEVIIPVLIDEMIIDTRLLILWYTIVILTVRK
jgi:hypothetical protein